MGIPFMLFTAIRSIGQNGRRACICPSTWGGIIITHHYVCMFLMSNLSAECRLCCCSGPVSSSIRTPESYGQIPYLACVIATRRVVHAHSGREPKIRRLYRLHSRAAVSACMTTTSSHAIETSCNHYGKCVKHGVSLMK